MTTEGQGVSLPGQPQTGKVPRPHTLDCLLRLLRLYTFAAAISLVSLMVRMGVGRSSTACNVVCLSHKNILCYWAFLPEDCYEDDFFLRCTV